MADRAAVGSIITRTGQSTVNMTTSRVVQGNPRTRAVMGDCNIMVSIAVDQHAIATPDSLIMTGVRLA